MSGVDHVLYEAVQAAVAAARTSPCAKSRRGVAIIDREWEGGRVVASASNGPPAPLACTSDAACRAACRRVAVHAEQRALLWALDRSRARPRAPVFEVVHAKVNEAGELVPSDGPSCVDCSKLMLAAGVRRVYLYQERADGPAQEPPVWRGYEALEFHELTLAALGLPAGRLA